MLSTIPTLGCFALSTQGRDKGSLYIIVKIIDHDFCLVADGRVRKMQNPKKKRVKHLKACQEFVSAALLAKIADGTAVDNELHKALLAYRQKCLKD